MHLSQSADRDGGERQMKERNERRVESKERGALEEATEERRRAFSLLRPLPSSPLSVSPFGTGPFVRFLLCSLARSLAASLASDRPAGLCSRSLARWPHLETVAHRGRRLTVRSAEAQRAKRGNERMRMGWDGKRGQKREEREDHVEGFYPIISMDEA